MIYSYPEISSVGFPKPVYILFPVSCIYIFILNTSFLTLAANFLFESPQLRTAPDQFGVKFG